MFENSYRLLSLFEVVENVRGRKKLQKMVHLLENAGTDFAFKFDYHFYGPYSAELQVEIEGMVRQGLLEEKKEDSAFVYRMTERGKQLKAQMETMAGYQFPLNETLAQSLSEQSSQFLEMVSTYAYLLDSDYDDQAAAEKAVELKPHLGHYMEDAVEFYRNRFCM